MSDLEIEICVECRASLAYAAGIGSSRSCYLDDLRDGGIIAPPAFCSVPEWAMVNGQAFRDTLRIADDSIQRGIHVYQDSIFHRAIKAPEALRVTCEIVQLRQTRIGALVSAKLVTYSADSESIITETWWSSIYLGINCDSVDGDCEIPPIEPGELIGTTERIKISVPRWFPHAYSECSGIWNPIHTERAVAIRQGLPDIITHGTAIWALVAEALIDRWCHGEPEALRRLSCRFKNAVIPGANIFLEHSIVDTKRQTHSNFVVANDSGELFITDGYAEFKGA